MKQVKIAFTGDIMCAPGLIEEFTQSDGKRDFSQALRDIRSELSADLLVGNLETPVAGEDLGLSVWPSVTYYSYMQNYLDMTNNFTSMTATLESQVQKTIDTMIKTIEENK